MESVAKFHDRRDAVVVPVVSLEELPRLTAEEHTSLIAELEDAEAEMKAGHYTTYSPEWLRERFLEIFNCAA